MASPLVAFKNCVLSLAKPFAILNLPLPPTTDSSHSPDYITGFFENMLKELPLNLPGVKPKSTYIVTSLTQIKRKIKEKK